MPPGGALLLMAMMSIVAIFAGIWFAAQPRRRETEGRRGAG